MGSRGASSGSSGGIKGATVKIGGTETDYFFKKVGNKNYYARGFGANFNETPNNMSMKEFISRAKSNGANVNPISKSQMKKMGQKHNEYRKDMDKFLNHSWFHAAGRPKPGMKGH